jgi:hypothetical protein
MRGSQSNRSKVALATTQTEEWPVVKITLHHCMYSLHVVSPHCMMQYIPGCTTSSQESALSSGLALAATPPGGHRTRAGITGLNASRNFPVLAHSSPRSSHLVACTTPGSPRLCRFSVTSSGRAAKRGATPLHPPQPGLDRCRQCQSVSNQSGQTERRLLRQGLGSKEHLGHPCQPSQ